MVDGGEYGTGELSRQIRDVLSRFGDLATRLETQFLRSEVFVLYQRLVDKAIHDLEEANRTKASAERMENVIEQVRKKVDSDSFKALETRVADLEDDKKWLVRLVVGFIVFGVLAAVFAVSKNVGKPL